MYVKYMFEADIPNEIAGTTPHIFNRVIKYLIHRLKLLPEMPRLAFVIFYYFIKNRIDLASKSI